ncbi:MAG: ATP-binding protein [Acidobacteriota bacterium]
MYDTLDELLREILAGEDTKLDWKEIVVRGNEILFVPKRASEGDRATVELAKDLTCFANTEGGVIVFGVRKDGERVGVPAERMDALQQLIANVAQNNIEPPLGHLLVFDRVWLPDSAGQSRLCLKIEIKRALFSVHAPKGRRPYWRIADQCHEMTLEQQARAFERRGMMAPFEERPAYTAGPDDLDSDRFKTYYQARFGEKWAEDEESLRRLMLNLKLLARDEASVLHPTALGVLLFSPEPDRWITGSYLDLAVYKGLEPDADRQVDAKTIRGTVVEQIEATMGYLRTSPYVPVAARKDDWGRQDRPAYSLRALQEGAVNALVHRDYTIAGSQVRVFVFPDRIEISSPGRLPNTLTPADLFAGCQPVRRNQMLAGFLRDYTSPLTGRSYMEARGEGFLAMVRECQRVSGRPPDLAVIGDSVKLTIFRERDG